MTALEQFIHQTDGQGADAMPVLLKAALAHVQFETIHPFLDGNGRLGRLLIAMLLHDSGALSQPLLYLSLYFKQHRALYYELLDRVRTEGDWEAWVDFFLEGVEQTAHGAVQTAKRLVDLFQQDTAARAGHRPQQHQRAARARHPAPAAPVQRAPARRQRGHQFSDGGQSHADAGGHGHRPRTHRPAPQPGVCVRRLPEHPE
jgi:Fic family protein